MADEPAADEPAAEPRFALAAAQHYLLSPRTPEGTALLLSEAAPQALIELAARGQHDAMLALRRAFGGQDGLALLSSAPLAPLLTVALVSPELGVREATAELLRSLGAALPAGLLALLRRVGALPALAALLCEGEGTGESNHALGLFACLVRAEGGLAAVLTEGGIGARAAELGGADCGGGGGALERSRLAGALLALGFTSDGAFAACVGAGLLLRLLRLDPRGDALELMAELEVLGRMGADARGWAYLQGGAERGLERLAALAAAAAPSADALLCAVLRPSVWGCYEALLRGGQHECLALLASSGLLAVAAAELLEPEPATALSALSLLGAALKLPGGFEATCAAAPDMLPTVFRIAEGTDPELANACLHTLGAAVEAGGDGVAEALCGGGAGSEVLGGLHKRVLRPFQNDRVAAYHLLESLAATERGLELITAASGLVDALLTPSAADADAVAWRRSVLHAISVNAAAPQLLGDRLKFVTGALAKGGSATQAPGVSTASR